MTWATVIKKAPQFANACQLRAIAHARLGRKDDAKADLAQFQKSTTDESTKLYLAVVVAAELGEGASDALDKLEAALKSQPKDVDLAYNAACAIFVGRTGSGQEGPGAAPVPGGSSDRRAQGRD